MRAGALADGEAVTVRIYGRVNREGTLSNAATVDSDQAEAVTTNNASEADVNVTAAVADVRR